MNPEYFFEEIYMQFLGIGLDIILSFEYDVFMIFVCLGILTLLLRYV